MRIYNTLTKRVEDFQSMETHKVKFFVCGPTVYDMAHLGHAKTYIQLDVLARFLRSQGYDVFYLQNITDIDDKIITRARERHISWEELRDQYEAEYKQDMQSLNNTSVTTYARATDYIPDIIKQVQTLMDKGHAYKIEDGIYFEVSTFPEYGKLSGRTEVKQDDAQTRIDHSEEKSGWNDFCLWKFSKPDEPVWDAPFGAGRPGWHIEDTAITEHFFGPQYDIHGGAVDLIFPHHEAEITQMESASGTSPFVKYWTHVGFLNIDSTKMSKSLGNFLTVREIIEKGTDPMAIRLFMLQSHYRSSINFSWDNLESSAARLQDLNAMADHVWQSRPHGIDTDTIQTTQNAMEAALSDDLNTPQAMSALSELAGNIGNSGIRSDTYMVFQDFLKWLDKVFALDLSSRQDISDEQKKLVDKRESARQAQDWQQSDALRDQLLAQGIVIRDTDRGSIWSRS